jgi:Na+-transporting NADH:ubiquinone oxidoreductase subunit F
MTAWMRTLHKWVALVLALQFVAWMASGLALSLIDHDAAAGATHRAPAAAATRPWPSGLVAPAQLLREPGVAVQRVESHWLLDRPVYRLTNDAGTWLVDAASGERLVVDAGLAGAIARHDYAGTVAPGAPERLDTAPREAIDHAPPLWRVRFADDVDTTLYVSAVDGRILERRNRSSRWFEFFWMLHTMDYSGRGNFNHPLVVVSALAALWVALTGVWLLLAPLRRRRVPARVPG